MMIPADHFTHQSIASATNHPRYPEELFDYLAGLSTTTHRAFAFDVRNDQAAHCLASRFDEVIAADPNHSKRSKTYSTGCLHYLCSAAGEIPLTEKSIDLITVSQAWHWLEANILEQEARRVLRPGGLLAVWGFNLLRVDEPISALVNRFYFHELKDYWPDNRKSHVQPYAEFPIHLTPLPTPVFAMHQSWTATQLLEYVLSWATTQKLISAGKQAVYDNFFQDVMEKLGGDDKLLSISWPLNLKVARKKF